MKKVIITDLSGTLARQGSRGRYDFQFVDSDFLISGTKEAILSHKLPIVIVTGRPEYCRPQTADWLRENGISYKRMYMRPDGDYRPASEMKLILAGLVLKNYQVEAWYEDCSAVSEMLRKIGICVKNPIF